MALLVKHVGQYPPHDIAHRAGVRKGDILTSFDGRTDLKREADLLAYAVDKARQGKSVEVRVLRDGKPMTFKMTLPK